MATPDIAARLRLAVDWSQCAVMGSYALHQYMQAAHLHDPKQPWFPNDIDVGCNIATHDAFKLHVKRVVDALATNPSTPPVVEKLVLLTDEERSARGIAAAARGDEERFHRSIIATATLRVPGIPVPVQLVGLDTTESRGDLEAHLDVVTDVPAAVSYRYTHYGSRIFHVPERAVQAIQTRRVPTRTICSSRMAKYAARGFMFY
jgi:hypothetical protein